MRWENQRLRVWGEALSLSHTHTLSNSLSLSAYPPLYIFLSLSLSLAISLSLSLGSSAQTESGESANWTSRSREAMATIKTSRPDSGFGIQAQVLEGFEVASFLESGVGPTPWLGRGVSKVVSDCHSDT